MNWIGKQAAFYRGYQPDDRSLAALTVLLSTTIALWLLVYLVAGDAEQGAASFDPRTHAPAGLSSWHARRAPPVRQADDARPATKVDP